jgi:hypothetical protein
MPTICKGDDCKIYPSFNYKGLKPKYCFNHKFENMINVKAICKNCNSERKPLFNFPDKKENMRCSNCKLIGMINIMHKKECCIYKNCNIRPTYNYEGKKKRLYCTNHKLEGMIDICHKKCVINNCTTIPVYNYKGLKGKYCSVHKLENMINVVNKSCIYENCITIPNYNYKGLKAKYCVLHKEKDMIDVKNKLCFICNKTIAWIDNNKYCSPCNAFINPDSKQGRKYCFKQNTIVDILKQHFTFDIIDKQINDGCTKRRPDLIIDCLTHVINIEIDEEQHKSKSYTPECEESRYNELFTAFGDRPIICIRFNPDKYIIKKNNKEIKIEGIFKNTKINEKELDERMKILIKTIKDSIEKIQEETFSIKYLFYDN